MPKRKKDSKSQIPPSGLVGAERWESFAWKAVEEEQEHFEGEDDGGYDDSMFFGLEELDGNSYKIKKENAKFNFLDITCMPIIN